MAARSTTAPRRRWSTAGSTSARSRTCTASATRRRRNSMTDRVAASLVVVSAGLALLGAPSVSPLPRLCGGEGLGVRGLERHPHRPPHPQPLSPRKAGGRGEEEAAPRHYKDRSKLLVVNKSGDEV